MGAFFPLPQFFIRQTTKRRVVFTVFVSTDIGITRAAIPNHAVAATIVNEGAINQLCGLSAIRALYILHELSPSVGVARANPHELLPDGKPCAVREPGTGNNPA